MTHINALRITLDTAAFSWPPKNNPKCAPFIGNANDMFVWGNYHNMYMQINHVCNVVCVYSISFVPFLYMHICVHIYNMYQRLVVVHICIFQSTLDSRVHFAVIHSSWARHAVGDVPWILPWDAMDSFASSSAVNRVPRGSHWHWNAFLPYCNPRTHRWIIGGSWWVMLIDRSGWLVQWLMLGQQCLVLVRDQPRVEFNGTRGWKLGENQTVWVGDLAMSVNSNTSDIQHGISGMKSLANMTRSIAPLILQIGGIHFPSLEKVDSVALGNPTL